MRLIDADALKGAFLEELFVKSGKSVQDIIDEAPTIEPSGDLISRADAIEAVCGKCSTETRMECVLIGYFCCDRRELEALPSADRPQGEDWDKYSEKLWELAYERGKNDRPKGEWVEDLNFVHRAWRCSKCFAVSSIKTPFCHECGADMRGGKDD